MSAVRSSIWRWNSPAIWNRWSPTSRRYGREPFVRPFELEDRVGRGLELVALGGDEPVQLVHALLEAVAAGQVLAARARAGPRPRARRCSPRSPRSPGSRRPSARRARGRRASPRRASAPRASVACRSSSASHASRRTVTMKLAGEVEVDLQRLGRPLRVPGHARRVEDQQHVVAVGVELRPLAELARVLERDRVQAERLAEPLDLLVVGDDEVDPEELVALAQPRDLAPDRPPSGRARR